MKTLTFLLTTLLTAAGLTAQDQTSTQSDRTSVSVTIYNAGMGLVRETRKTDLKKGILSLRYEDVASQIIPQTVRIKSRSNPDKLTVFEQNYEYDLISSGRLMDKYIGKEVKLFRLNENGTETEYKAKLISNNDGPVYQIGSEISLGFPGRVVVPSIPDNLFEHPTLIWKLNNQNSGSQELEVSYQTNGMNWSADYILILDESEKTADLASWVTLDNQSGARFENATLQLVAGEVKRANEYTVTAYAPLAKGRMNDEIFSSDLRAPQFEQENLSEYYLYTLDQPTTIGMNQTKQVQLFSTGGVSVLKRYIFENLPMYSGEEKNFNKAEIRYEFKNSKDNQLGRPLPKGTIRAYKADSKGRQQLLGEDLIDHTPNDELVKITTGEAFDVVANGKQLSYENFSIGSGYHADYEVSLRNRKTEDITIRVYANLAGDWKITESSHKAVKESAFKAYFDVPVKAGAEVKLTYSVKVSYK